MRSGGNGSSGLHTASAVRAGWEWLSSGPGSLARTQRDPVTPWDTVRHRDSTRHQAGLVITPGQSPHTDTISPVLWAEPVLAVRWGGLTEASDWDQLGTSVGLHPTECQDTTSQSVTVTPDCHSLHIQWHPVTFSEIVSTLLASEPQGERRPPLGGGPPLSTLSRKPLQFWNGPGAPKDWRVAARAELGCFDWAERPRAAGQTRPAEHSAATERERERGDYQAELSLHSLLSQLTLS